LPPVTMATLPVRSNSFVFIGCLASLKCQTSSPRNGFAVVAGEAALAASRRMNGTSVASWFETALERLLTMRV
jgi:hypothetical protein